MSAIYRGKSIIITGGAGGMGRITARLLLKKGASVILVDISEAVLAEVATTLNAGGRVVTLCSNLSDFDACLAAFHAASTPVHALIHLAGISLPDPDDPADASVFDTIIAANTRTAYLMARAFEAQRLGSPSDTARIVLASSLAYRRGGLDRVAYSASKGAITAMVRALSRRLAPNVLVNGVAPGIITTPMTDQLIAARGGALMREIPIGRFGEPMEVASVLEFLISPSSSYVNGQIINIDGGTIHS